MKRLLALVSLFSFCQYAYANDEASFTVKIKKNIERGNLYTVLLDITDYYKKTKPSKEMKVILSQVIEKTGPHFFNTFSDLELRNIGIPATDLIMAKRNLYLGKYNYAFKRLNKLYENPDYKSESLLIKGDIYYKQNNFESAINTFKECSEMGSDSQNEFVRFHLETVQNNCRINLGRTYYKMRQFEKAIESYNLVPKRSAKWPYTLLEKAWSYYQLNNYNRALGILLTFNSPLLESYFFPEAQLLKAMSYFRMCYFEESEHIIKVFYNKYKPKSSELRALLKEESPLKFFNLVFSARDLVGEKSFFMKNLLTQVEKRSKFKLDMSSLFNFNAEIYKSSKYSRLNDVLEMQKDLKNQINHSVRLSMFNFINQIHSTSEYMFNLQLEILSKRREQLYKRQNNVLTQLDGDIKNIDIKSSDVFWDFKKSFWADELGDYTLALKNNCSRSEVKK